MIEIATVIAFFKAHAGTISILATPVGLGCLWWAIHAYRRGYDHSPDNPDYWVQSELPTDDHAA